MDATSPAGPRGSRVTATDPARATTHAWAAPRMVAPCRPNLTAKLAMMPPCGGKALPGYRVEWLVAAYRAALFPHLWQ